ncbi:trp operon leader peptide [Streptomyces abyssalis]|nr:trp operon leader peptide [Streptomyces abyssalis]
MSAQTLPLVLPLPSAAMLLSDWWWTAHPAAH